MVYIYLRIQYALTAIISCKDFSAGGWACVVVPDPKRPPDGAVDPKSPPPVVPVVVFEVEPNKEVPVPAGLGPNSPPVGFATEAAGVELNSVPPAWED